MMTDRRDCNGLIKLIVVNGGPMEHGWFIDLVGITQEEVGTIRALNALVRLMFTRSH